MRKLVRKGSSRGVRVVRVIGPAPAQPAAKAKPGRTEPGAKVVAVTETTPLQAHGLRAALGLRTPDAETAERTAREITEHRQRAAAKVAEQRQRIGTDVPAAAKPTIVDRPRPQTANYASTGERLPEISPELAQVYLAITAEFVRANRLPVTLSVGELAGQTGLTAEQVNSAIVELERRQLITRQPHRAGSLPRFAPAAI